MACGGILRRISRGISMVADSPEDGDRSFALQPVGPVLLEGSAPHGEGAVECRRATGAGSFGYGQRNQSHGARRVACRGCAATGSRLGCRARGRAVTEVPVALRSTGSARTGMSGPGPGSSEKVAPRMAGNRSPYVARRSPRSLGSVVQTSPSDPGWAFPGPAVIRAATCRWQVGHELPSKGTEPTGSPLRGIANAWQALSGLINGNLQFPERTIGGRLIC